MRHGRKIRKLGVKQAHRKQMLINIARGLVYSRRIITTEARAKVARQVIDRLVTHAKAAAISDADKAIFKTDEAARTRVAWAVHKRRLVYRVLRDRKLVTMLCDDIAPNFTSEGGYTRVLKAGHRKGDNASMAVLEFALPNELLINTLVKAE